MSSVGVSPVRHRSDSADPDLDDFENFSAADSQAELIARLTADNQRLERQSAPPNDNDRIAQLEAENHRLEQQRIIAGLEQRNRELRGIQLNPAIAAPAASSPSTLGATPKPKTFRPAEMRPYKGQSEGEHMRWFRDVDIKFIMSPEYFTTDRDKIIFCMQSLEGDPATQWYQYFGAHDVAQITFAKFKEFLLDLVADPVNRRLAAYERWEEAKQRADQKVSVFKAALEDIEAQLPPFSEEHRANFFLAKLRPALKDKILSTGNVPRQREEILAQAIMQEKVLERGRPAGGTKPGSGGSQKLEDRITKPGKTARSGGKPSQSYDQGAKRKLESAKPNPDHKESTCYHCGKKGHWKPECPDIDKPAVANVGAVSAKNDLAPTQPQKRSKKKDQ